MNKLTQIITFLLFLASICTNAQNIIWTGAAGNNDFFDEGNWKDAVTNGVPASGTINPAIAINLPLQINTVVATITANGEINLGSGSLGITNANLTAQSLAGQGGALNLNAGAYVELTTTTPIKSSNPKVQINLTSGLAWLRTKNVSPRLVLLSYLGQIKVNGNASAYQTNLRLDNYYLSGCVIRTNEAATSPLTVFEGANLQGTAVLIPVNKIHSGDAIPGTMNNKIESFVLKKGFMVTFADQADGTGKSKNYIASETDLVINDLPKVLQNSISFIRVMPWNWVTKKGFNAPVDYSNLNVSWRYQWNGNESSNTNWEFAPMSWGQGTADSDADILNFVNLYNTTHLMSFNEPDDCAGQSGQYGNPKLCVTDEAVKWHKNLMKTGMRMVSPGGREEAPFGWLKEFYQKATAQDVRIDVIAVHWYDWGSSPKTTDNATGDAVFNRFKSYLTKVHDLYGLPIWITEFNANPARSQAVNARFLELALPYLESLDYIERYCWFPFNTGTHFTTGWDEINRVPTNTIPSLVGTIYKNINNTNPTASNPSIPEATVDATNNLNLVEFPNVALNKSAVANSSYSASNLPPKAVDGELTSTQWFLNFGVASDVNYTPLPAWFEVDLQGSYTIDSFRIIESSKALKDFNFQVWDATLNSGVGGWSNVTTVTGNPATPLTTYKSFTPVTTTKVRLFITGHNSTNYLRLLELEVYGYVATALRVQKFKKKTFTIYPNPVTNDVLNISGDQEVESIAVYNISGNKINAPFENGQLRINGLASGVYFLKLNDTYSYKFIKK
jgi:hypothetical protein